ncbi:MAG TPA: PDZ domain-containing protein, partial [Longimicrobiaceae bacterium]|nr:PDZ domain-containing protein [Longimicrobiaceae bacterium]
QQAVAVPASGKSGDPGFSHAWEAGLVRTQSGWMARDYPRVTGVAQGSTAARAGVREGDVIVSVNGHDSRRPPLFRDLRPGSTVVLRIRRGGEEREIRYEIEK